MDLQYSTPPGPPQSISSGESMSPLDSQVGDLGGPGSVYGTSATQNTHHYHQQNHPAHHFQQQQQQLQLQQQLDAARTPPGFGGQEPGQGPGPGPSPGSVNPPQDSQAQAGVNTAANASSSAPSVPAACLACVSACHFLRVTWPSSQSLPLRITLGR